MVRALVSFRLKRHLFSFAKSIKQLIVFSSFFSLSYIYILWRIGCLPLNIIITPSHCPSPDSWQEWVCERGGTQKQPIWQRVMRHTWSEWSLITAAVKSWARLSSRERYASRWTCCFEWDCTLDVVDGPGGWAVILPPSAVGQEKWVTVTKPPPIAPWTREGSTCSRRTRASTWTPTF